MSIRSLPSVIYAIDDPDEADTVDHHFHQFIKNFQWERDVMRYVAFSAGTTVVLFCTCWNLFNMYAIARSKRDNSNSLFHVFMCYFHLFNQMNLMSHLYLIYLNDIVGVVTRTSHTYACQLSEFFSLFTWLLVCATIISLSINRLYLVYNNKIVPAPTVSSSCCGTHIVIAICIFICALCTLPIALSFRVKVYKKAVYLALSYNIKLMANSDHIWVMVCGTNTNQWSKMKDRLMLLTGLVTPSIFTLVSVLLLCSRCYALIYRLKMTIEAKRSMKILVTQIVIGLLLFLQSSAIFALIRHRKRRMATDKAGTRGKKYPMLDHSLMKEKLWLDIFQYIGATISTIASALLAYTSSSYRTTLHECLQSLRPTRFRIKASV